MALKKAKTEEKSIEPTSQSPRPRLHKLTVSNFRCIGSQPVEIELDDIVVLVGPNNAGKSSILRAYEVVMEHGSNEGKLTLDDFPLGKIDEENQPTIELVTVVFEKTAPGEQWIMIDPASREMFVREKWTWNQPGSPKKVGWAKEVNFAEDMMQVHLTDGRIISVPVIWFPLLHEATPEQREKYEIGAGGASLHWEEIDEDISVVGLLAGGDL